MTTGERMAMAEKSRAKTAFLLGGCALLAVIFSREPLPPKSNPVAMGIEAMASCDAIELEVTDLKKRIIKVATQISFRNGARFSAMTYSFEQDKVPVTFNNSSPVIHDYPDTPAIQDHTVTAIVEYEWGDKIYGGLPVCTTQVSFRSQPNP